MGVSGLASRWVGAIASGALLVALVGIAGSPAGAVNPPYFQITVVGGSSDFGNQLVGTNTASKQLLVKNVSGSSVTFTTNTFPFWTPDLFQQDFDIIANGCMSTTVANNGYCSIYVWFQPTTTGLRQATLNVAGTGYLGTQSTGINLSGTGIAPSLSAAPSSLDFGDQDVAVPSATSTVTVTNSGSADLNLSSVGVTGADAADFEVTADTCSAAVVVPTGTCTVDVRFTPGATGSRTAALEILSDASTSPDSVGLSGKGVVPGFSSDANPVAFGDQQVATTSSPRTVTVTNTGDGNLVFGDGDVALGGPDTTMFAITADTCSGNSVGPAGTCSVDVTFTPGSSGAKSGLLRFTSNAAGSPHEVPLSGSGTTPTAPGSGPGDDPANDLKGLKAQVPGNQSAGLPKRIRRSGITVIAGPKAITDAGQSISTKVRATPKRAPGTQRTYKVIRKKNGKVSIRTFGFKRLTVVVAQTAPATTGYRPYAQSATYFKGKRR